MSDYAGDDYVVVKGAWANEPGARDAAWQAFSAAACDMPADEALAAFDLWWKEGRTEVGGQLTLWRDGDRIVPRDTR
jgi:hypothetical protein